MAESIPTDSAVVVPVAPVDVAIDLLSDGTLMIRQADGVVLAVPLTRSEALDLARGLIEFADPGLATVKAAGSA